MTGREEYEELQDQLIVVGEYEDNWMDKDTFEASYEEIVEGNTEVEGKGN